MCSWTFVALSTNFASCDFLSFACGPLHPLALLCGGACIVTIGIGLMRLAAPKLPPRAARPMPFCILIKHFAFLLNPFGCAIRP